MPRRKKEPVTQDPQAETQDQDQDPQEDIEDGVTLEVEVPDDVAEKGPPPTQTEKLTAKMKDAAKDFITVDHSQAKSKVPKRKAFQKLCDAAAGFIVIMLEGLLPDAWFDQFEVVPGDVRQLAPTKAQVKEILVPIGRIADRHIGLNIDNPDIDDMFKSLGLIALYAYDLRANVRIYRMMLEQEELAKRGTYNGYTADPQATTDKPYEAKVADFSQYLDRGNIKRP